MVKGEVHAGFWWRKREGKITFGRPKCRWKDNIKMKL
jgi:hypothetical protein